jgi:hypothetical protein|tara:strand:+ start:925 stop:1029 length:105 start_codon:yes stop_codon:yes gene_type:complete
LAFRGRDGDLHKKEEVEEKEAGVMSEEGVFYEKR